MAEQIQLEVITPERRALAETVESVTVPGMTGEIGILPGHTPLISQLQTGVLSFVTSGGENATPQRLHVSGGFVEVSADRVTVLAERAERPEEIDANRARTAREQAELILNAANSSDEELEQARLQLERATIRLQLAAENQTSTVR